jgi:hypothetical protein
MIMVVNKPQGIEITSKDVGISELCLAKCVSDRKHGCVPLIEGYAKLSLKK